MYVWVLVVRGLAAVNVRQVRVRVVVELPRLVVRWDWRRFFDSTEYLNGHVHRPCRE